MSKSVRLSSQRRRRPAATKNTPMTISAGATKTQAAMRRCLGCANYRPLSGSASFPPRNRLCRAVGGRPPWGVASASELGGLISPRQHPAPLLEDRVDARVECGHRRVDARAAVHARAAASCISCAMRSHSGTAAAARTRLELLRERAGVAVAASGGSSPRGTPRCCAAAAGCRSAGRSRCCTAGRDR